MNFFSPKTLGTQQREEHNIFSDAERQQKKINEQREIKSPSKISMFTKATFNNVKEDSKKNIKSSKGFKVSGRGGFRL